MIYEFYQGKDTGVTVCGKDIRYSGNGELISVTQLHRHLQALAMRMTGEECSLDITSSNPSQMDHKLRRCDLLNGYKINEELAEHLCDGVLTQDNGEWVWFTNWTTGTEVLIPKFWGNPYEMSEETKELFRNGGYTEEE
jgi:hypothetical protein